MIFVIDTETTGREPPEVIELACMPIAEGTWQPTGQLWCKRFRSKLGSAYGALATHHILNEEIADETYYYAEAPLGVEPADYLIGHNIDYDWTALGSPPCRRICTLAISRWLLPEVDSHSLSALTYYFSPNKVQARELLRHAHGAAVDVGLCHSLLLFLLDASRKSFASAEELYLFSESCRIPKVWSFGKFKGQPIAAADRGYLSWCLKQSDMDPYVLKAVRAVSK